MPIEYQKSQAVFRDVVGVDEAEGLLEWLLKRSSARLDLAACVHLHAANLQVLMATRARIAAWPDDAGLNAWLKTALNNE